MLTNDVLEALEIRDERIQELEYEVRQLRKAIDGLIESMRFKADRNYDSPGR
jgi:hypothetical protein